MTKGFLRFLRRNTIALLALFLALGGTTYAASTALIGNNTVASPQVVNGSLKAKDLSKAARTALKGNRGLRGLQGAQGAQGAKGATGAQGVQGAIGPSDVYSVGDGSTAGSTTPLTKAVPAGDYVVTAKVVNYSASADTTTRCDLTGGTGADISFGNIATGAPVPHQETLNSQMVTHFDAPGTLTWSCIPATVTHGYAALSAIKVGATH